MGKHTLNPLMSYINFLKSKEQNILMYAKGERHLHKPPSKAE